MHSSYIRVLFVTLEKIGSHSMFPSKMTIFLICITIKWRILCVKCSYNCLRSKETPSNVSLRWHLIYRTKSFDNGITKKNSTKPSTWLKWRCILYHLLWIRNVFGLRWNETVALDWWLSNHFDNNIQSVKQLIAIYSERQMIDNRSVFERKQTPTWTRWKKRATKDIVWKTHLMSP